MLIEFLSALWQDVRITVKPTRKARATLATGVLRTPFNATLLRPCQHIG
jgi:hypothetical protein